jgi:hypothetical protein
MKAGICMAFLIGEQFGFDTHGSKEFGDSPRQARNMPKAPKTLGTSAMAREDASFELWLRTLSA